MATKIVTKNSSTASAVPTASDLVQGELAVNVADKRLFTENNAGAIVELGTNPSTLTVTGEITANGGIALGDNDKATFGASDDLEIYHDGTNNRLTFVSANTYIQTDGTIHFTDIGNSEKHFTINDNGAVDLYYDNSKKLATTSTGIDVTGTATMDGLTVDGDVEIKANGGNSPLLAKIWNTGTSTNDDAVLGFLTQGNRNYSIGISRDTGSFNVSNQDGSVDSGKRLTVNNNGDISFYEDTGTTPKFFWDASAESLGIGTDSPTAKLTLNDAGQQVGIDFKEAGTTRAHIEYDGAIPALELGTNGAANVVLKTSSTERMRIDSSGNVLVGKSGLDFGATSGQEFRADGRVFIGHSGAGHFVNRIGSDGSISEFRKDGTTVGSIGTVDGFPYISSNSNVGLKFLSSRIRPVNSDGSDRDDAIDLGASSARFDDIYATNGTIQTSDRNEKQDIEVLSEAEQRVAVAAKGLLRKFRWKDSVAEKGDDARIHFGIIAQDLQDAFAAEGLDAGDYAMFISTTWTDEETNEEKTRMGVRYSELLAFIISAL